MTASFAVGTVRAWGVGSCQLLSFGEKKTHSGQPLFVCSVMLSMLKKLHVLVETGSFMHLFFLHVIAFAWRLSNGSEDTLNPGDRLRFC